MAGNKPGPTCSSNVGPNWIDAGTTCRARSGPSGPLGILMSLVMGASPQTGESKEEQRATMAMITYDIDVISDSPFGKTAEGKDIVKRLRSLNSRGKVAYGGNMDGTRGDWDGQIIRIDERFRGNAFRTITELVHEASHARWRSGHPLVKGQVSSLKGNVDDELRARENQLIIYKYLKEKKGCPEDIELELRLRQQAAGTMRQSIEEGFNQ